MEPLDMNNILGLLRKSEQSGELVLRQKAEIVHMDRISQKNREAYNAIKRRPDNETVYLCTGNMFIKHHVQQAKQIIENDQKDISKNVDKLHDDIKKNLQIIHEIEDKGDRFGASFNLNPLSHDEMKGFDLMLKQIKNIEL